MWNIGLTPNNVSKWQMGFNSAFKGLKIFYTQIIHLKCTIWYLNIDTYRYISHWGRNVGWGCFRIGCWGELFGAKRGEVTGEWRKLHNEELNDLYCSPNIVLVITSRRIRWAEHVARMGRKEMYTEFWWGNLRERDHWGDSDVDERIILRWIFRKWDVGRGDWMELAPDRDRWRALVGTVRNFRVP